MQELIYEFYGIYPYFDQGLHFFNDGIDYIVYPCNDEGMINGMVYRNVLIEKTINKSSFMIIKNKYNQYLSNGYILLGYVQTEINLHELFLINQLPYDHNPLDLNLIRDKWVNRIDFVSRRYLQLLDYNHPCFEQYMVMSTFYLGLAENAVSYLVDVLYDHKNVYMSSNLSHSRIHSLSFETLCNPLYFIQDNRVRDVVELYSNQKIELTVVEKYIHTFDLTNKEIHYLMARALYPNYYFDLIEEDYFKENDNYQKILEVYHKIDLDLLRIKELYLMLNKIFPLRPIEWIMNN